MNLLANPREGAQDRNNDEDASNNTSDNYSTMLNSAMPYNVDDLED